jgi:hypothetical protein
VKTQLAIQVVDGHVGQRSKGPVDPTDDLVDHGAQALVLGHVRARGDGDLDEEDAVAPLGVLLQKLLKRQQLLRDPLDDVQAVDA